MLANSRKPSHFLAALFVTLQVGCLDHADVPSVVVYTALDSEFSEPILEAFSQEMGIPVRAKFDVESTKTVGLTNAIIAEENRPRCDVFWNNEILNTLRLKEEGLLDVYRSSAAAEYPEMFRDADGMWHGFAARARILIVNTEVVPEDSWPKSIYDMADEKWKGKVSIAKPLFGTTATHAACLFESLGEAKAKEFFHSLKQNNVKIEAGNKQVALAVASGSSAFGLTDTDDALVMINRGHPVKILYPDQADDQLGTLFIPNTLAIIKDSPNPEQARRLVDYLLKPPVEIRLAKGPSGQIPLNPTVEVELRVESPRSIKAMEVDFDAAVQHWDAAAEFIRQEFSAE